MAKARALDVVRTAIELVSRASPPLYSQMDCQAFVEYCVNQHGSPKINYRGSNDMIRNACSWVGTLEEAKKLGYLRPGVWLFILKQDGGEPDRYKGDGIGNSNHVGIYTDTDSIEVVHSSASRGKVAISTLKNAWNRVGVPKDVYFDWWEGGDTPVAPDVKPPTTNTYPTLRKGDKGSFVKDLQQRLYDMGYDIGKNTQIDGKFGEKTFQAVRQFQADRNLYIDGVVGQATWSALVAFEDVRPDEPDDEDIGEYSNLTIRDLPKNKLLELKAQYENMGYLTEVTHG